MDRLIERCCGLDVHKTSIAACVRIPGPEGERVQHVRTFGTTTVQLLALRDWLEAHGVTHVAMVAALGHGTTAPAVLADLARGKLRRKRPALREALAGHFRAHHGFLVGQLLAHLDFLDESLETLNGRIDEMLAPFAETLDRLDRIPGFSRHTAEDVVAEIGLDMAVFPSDGHLASWAGLCPGQNESAGKRRSGRTRKGNRWLRRTLVHAAHAASR